MKDKEIPCESCICYAICRTIVSNIKATEPDKVHAKFMTTLIDRCVLFSLYVKYKVTKTKTHTLTVYSIDNLDLIYETFNMERLT